MGFNNNYYKQANNIFNLKLKPNQFTILSYLVRMSNECDNCYPSMNNISEMCCVSKSTVVRVIGELEEAGYISVNIDNTFNIYTINYDVIETTNNRKSKEESKRSRRSITKRVSTQAIAQSPGEESRLSEGLTLEERLVHETGASVKRVEKAIEYAVSKNAKNVLAYAKNTIDKNWDIEDSSNVVNVNFKKHKFTSYNQRTYDFEELERKLLGWDK